MMGVSAQNNRINLAIAAWEWPSYFDTEERLKGIRLDMANIADLHRKLRPAPSRRTVYDLHAVRHAAESKGYADALTGLARPRGRGDWS